MIYNYLLLGLIVFSVVYFLNLGYKNTKNILEDISKNIEKPLQKDEVEMMIADELERRISEIIGFKEKNLEERENFEKEHDNKIFPKLKVVK